MPELLPTFQPRHRAAISLIVVVYILPPHLAATLVLTYLAGLEWGLPAFIGALVISLVVWDVNVQIPRKSEIGFAIIGNCLPI